MSISDIVTFTGIFATLVFALWKLKRFIGSREDKDRVVAKISCRILDNVDKSGCRVADVRLTAKNVGRERLVIGSIFMSVRGIDDKIKVATAGTPNQGDFPISIASKRRMFPDSWGYSYIDPRQTVSYKHLTKIPAGIKSISITGKIEFSDLGIGTVTESEIFDV